MNFYSDDTYGERVAGVYDDWYNEFDPDAIAMLTQLAGDGKALERKWILWPNLPACVCVNVGATGSELRLLRKAKSIFPSTSKNHCRGRTPWSPFVPRRRSL